LAQAGTIEVGDDDGTSEYGFIYLNRPGSDMILKKTLILDASPGNSGTAFIKYYCHNQPYRLEKASEIPDLIVRINGKEAYRARVSLVNATKGWHTLPVDPKLLVMGANTIEFMLSDFKVDEANKVTIYFGLDSSKPQGRSRFFYLKSWTKGGFGQSVSKVGEGEFMVRLLLSANDTAKASIPYIDNVISIDGNVDAGEWSKALVLKDFRTLNSKKVASEQTEIYLRLDNDNLYIGGICYGNAGALKAAVRDRDGKVWADDSLDLFLDIKATKRSYYHYVINSLGTLYDSYCPLPAQHTPSWDGKAEATAIAEKDRWMMEMRIPLSDLLGEHYKDFSGNVSLGFNACRNNKSASESSSWTVFKGTNIHAPDQFVTFTGDRDAGGDKITFSVVNRVALTTDRVWPTDAPLFAELISDKPRAYPEIGGMVWSSEVSVFTDRNRMFGLQTGMAYTRNTFLDAYRKSGVLVEDWPGICNFMSKGTREYAEARKYGLKILYKDSILYKIYKDSLAQSQEKNASRLFIFGGSSDVLEQGIAASNKVLKDNLDIVWGAVHDDEAVHSAFTEFYKAVFSNGWPYRDTVDREIKERFGFGKYGLPADRNDNNPFRWIATNRYIAGRVIDAYKMIYQGQKKIAPDMPVMSTTHRGGYNTFMCLSRLADYIDISTQQITSDLVPVRQTVAFYTKYMKDLSDRKPCIPVCHVENYQAAFTGDETNELLSQAFRGGAETFMYYPADVANGYYSGLNYSNMDYYGSRARWERVNEIFSTVKNMKRLNYPSADTAVFISTDTEMAMESGYASGKLFERYQMPLFTVLGPRLGGWFDYIEDNQVEDKKINLDNYRVIYVPNARYERKAAADALLEYARRGGTLVLGNPETFRYDVTGNDRMPELSSIYGISVNGNVTRINGTHMLVHDKALGRDVSELLMQGMEGMDVHPAGAQVLGTYGDNRPAMTGMACGKGRIIVFAYNPFTQLETGAWGNVVRNIQEASGSKSANGIWRFKFPETRRETPAEKLRCLTGNYFEWVNNQPQEKDNEKIGGYYSYSLTPDGMRENKDGEIPFGQGKLVNRLRNLTDVSCVSRGPKGEKTALSDWAVSWDSREAFNITFVFAAPVKPQQVRLFYTGDLPDFRILVSKDGNNYQQAGRFTGQVSDDREVPCYKARFDVGDCRYVRLELGKRTGQLTIGEVDIWGAL